MHINQESMNSATIGRITTRDRVSRGERILHQLVDKHALTQEGYEAVIAAVDPMHDRPIKDLQGWPDLESTPSVVRCIKKSVTIATYGAGLAYDMHIVVWPMAYHNAYNRVITRVNNQITDSTTTSAQLGGVQVFLSPVGVPLDIAIHPSINVEIDLDFLEGACRLIGHGFEVHDTTAPLNKQGSCVCYRQSESSTVSPELWTCKDSWVGTHAMTPFSVHKVRHPPLSPSEALLLPGSVQWESAKGCYVVSPFCGAENPVQLVSYTTALVEAAVGDEAMITPNITPVWFRTFQNPAIPTDPYISSPARTWPIHQTGAIFSGLNPLSTFTVQVNAYIESFPTADDKAIVVLATPSATFDPVAIEIISRCMADLPVGVPADWNGFGDWFADVVKDVSSYMWPVAMAINPMLGAAVGGISAASNAFINRREALAKQAAAKKTLAPSKKQPPKGGANKKKK